MSINTILKIKNNNGTMLVVVLLATGIFLALLSGGISLALLQKKLIAQRVSRAQALHIAESGVNYYRWVLYHDHDEYCNKEICKTPANGFPEYGPYGPYSYQDFNGEVTGQYELYITPPLTNGSTIVDVTAVGWTTSHPNAKRKISVKCGIPSWSTYSWQSNSFINFGASSEVWGPIHSNAGIRFDGIAHNIITSSALTYNDPDHLGANEFGVHTHTAPVDPLPDGNNPPLNVPIRSDVFMAGRSFPTPVISYDLLDAYITESLAKATTDGIVLGKSGGSNQGYHIVLRTDDKIDIYIVNSITPQCRNGSDRSDTDGIVTETLLQTGVATPANGLVFVKDNVWVDGQIDGNRITIFAFDEPLGGSVSDININHSVLYTNYDGSDAIGLIAQRNIEVGLFSDNDLRIDAAMIAKEGTIKRNQFFNKDTQGCSSTYCVRNSLTTNGSLASFNRPYFWSGSCGYSSRSYNYDSNLTFAPPPHYPTTGEYTFISWDEE